MMSSISQKGGWLAAASVVLFAAMAARGEVKASVERNEAAAASGEFKFKTVPRPSRSDAGSKAKLSVLDGARDQNGGDIAVLT